MDQQKNNLIHGFISFWTIIVVLFIVVVVIAGAWFFWPKSAPEKIDNFEECLQAGYPVLESYPRQCRTSAGQMFVEEVETCQNLCNDGICQEIVCLAIGCPCPETKESCPADCQ